MNFDKISFERMEAERHNNMVIGALWGRVGSVFRSVSCRVQYFSENQRNAIDYSFFIKLFEALKCELFKTKEPGSELRW